jgi:hypothetical protein
VDLASLAGDAAYRLKVLSMAFPEAAARAKAGRFDVKETLTLTRGKESIVVEEVGHIRFNSRGDMEVELRTGPSDAMALVYANEVLYLRNRQGSWRTSRDPRDERHFWADQVYAALRTTAEMVHAAMVLKNKTEEVLEGRNTTRFELSLQEQPNEAVVDLDMQDGGNPAVTLPPDAGLFRAALERRTSLKGAKPLTLVGSVAFDNATGVPVRVSLQTTLGLARKAGETSVMGIKLETSLTELTKDAEIKAPAEAVEEIVRRRTPVHPLEFLDGGAGKAATGRATDSKPKQLPKTAPQEPADDEE